MPVVKDLEGHIVGLEAMVVLKYRQHRAGHEWVFHSDQSPQSTNNGMQLNAAHILVLHFEISGVYIVLLNGIL